MSLAHNVIGQGILGGEEEELAYIIESAKLDTWMSGQSSPAIRLAAYTPHLPADTKVKAGYRLFKSEVLTMDFADPAEIPTNYVQDSPNWEDE